MSCNLCCMRLGDCGICTDGPVCVTRYLCGTVNLTPSPSSDYPCCGDLEFRMFGGSDEFTGKCGWRGGGTCGDMNISLDIRIAADEHGDCITTVFAQANDVIQTTVYSGVITSFDFTMIDLDGNEYAILIGPVGLDGGLIANPVFDIPCSECVCGECAPRKFCLIFTSNSVYGTSCGVCKQAEVYTYNETTCSYLGNPFICGDVTYTVEMFFDRDRGCAIFGKIHSENLTNVGLMPGGCAIGCMDFAIPIDGSQVAPIVENPDGIVCREQGNLLKNAAPNAFPLQMYAMSPSNSAVTIYYLDPLTQLVSERAYLAIKDASCGTDSCIADFPFCYGGCPSIAQVFSPNTMPCPDVTLTATVIAPGCDYDGAVCELSHNPVCDPFPFTVGGYTEPEHCVRWCGNLLLTCASAATLQVPLFFWSSIRQCGDADDDQPFSYRLGTPWGNVSCDGIGIGPGPYNHGPHTPIAATCSPFVMDFEVPVVCKGFGTPPVNIPFCDPDAGPSTNTCTKITIRVTL